MIDFKQSKIFQLTNLLNEENWQHVKVSKKDQSITDSMIKLEVSSQNIREDEEQKDDQINDLSDFMISVCSEDMDRLAPGNHKYKVVSSCIEFQKIIHEYIMFATNF